MSEQFGERPVLVKVLGEELVLFRDLSGRNRPAAQSIAAIAGRRSSTGSSSERGIRCCYHGWLFDVDGTILEAPGEPADSPIPRKLCHGAYPAREFAGLVFAYLGPPELTPEFPMLDTFSLPGVELVPYAIDYPCNSGSRWPRTRWTQFHSVFLHTRVTRAHFNPAWGAMPVVEVASVRRPYWDLPHQRAPLGGLHLGTDRRGPAPGHRAAAGHLPEPGPGEVLPRRRDHQVDGAGGRTPTAGLSPTAISARSSTSTARATARTSG